MPFYAWERYRIFFCDDVQPLKVQSMISLPRLLAVVFSCMILAGQNIMAGDIAPLSFAAGETEARVDGFPGVAGEGWITPWQLHGDRGEVQHQIRIDSPPRGLQISYECTEITEGGQSSRAVLRRQLDPFFASEPLVYECVVQFGHDGQDPDWSSRSNYWSVGAAAKPYSRINQLANFAWLVRAGQDGWQAAIGDGKGGYELKTLSTHLPQANTPYTIRVSLNPKIRQWSVRLSGGGENAEINGLAVVTSEEIMNPDFAPSYLVFLMSVSEIGQRLAYTLKRTTVETLHETF